MWRELTQQEQQDELGQIEALAITTTPDLHGLQQLLRNEYRFQSQVQQRKQRIEQLGAEREAGRVTAENERVKMEREKLIREGRQTLQRTIRVPSRVTSQTQLDQLLNDLQQFKRELPLYTDFNLTLEVEDQ
jgi:hypothetical protein